MKKVLLGETYSCNVYLVPNEVADNLREYCLKYCTWLSKSPEAESIKRKMGRSPSDDGFIGYLNKFAFPQYESKLVEELDGVRSPIELEGMPEGSFRYEFMANTNLPDRY
ncbi:MAG: hypothetical protein J6V77_01915, partial [Clostridia bacterium]|nr:hypothetical protein [Clostridia bacterium]